MQYVETPREIEQLWEQACKIDPTLKIMPPQSSTLYRRRLRSTSFSRDSLFGAMARGEPILFGNFSIPVRGELELGVRDAVLEAIRTGLPSDDHIRVRCGPSGTEKYFLPDDLIRRWRNSRARVSVTDLHIRDTHVDRLIDCSRLCDFNLLAEVSGEVGDEEMLTMVMSSAGTFTDSHSDDPDGSNHCFAGRKLWLVWDTFVGLSKGLEDVERVDVFRSQAEFNISAFLSVPGSLWFTVEIGQTLFLPGHLTHKVITLEDYLGVGSFFVMLPSYLRTLLRWTEHTPLWALKAPVEQRLELVDKITQHVTQKVDFLATASEQARSQWGLKYCYSTLDGLQATSQHAMSLLVYNPVSARLVDVIRNARTAP